LYQIGGGNTASSTYVILANIIAISVAIVYSFTLNSIFTFKTRDQLLKRFLSFTAVSIIGMVISTLILVAATTLGIAPTPAKIVSLPFIFIVQFTLNRLLTFRSSHRLGADIETMITEGDII
jgi:putative flippase GtrA